MKLQVIASADLIHRFGEPEFGTPGAAAIDLRAMLNDPLSEVPDGAFDGSRLNCALEPGEVFKINTGLRIWLNDATKVGIIAPRSSMGKKGIGLTNTIGVIDSDYQGPLMLMVKNVSNRRVWIEDGERIAQYFVTNAFQFDMDLVASFSDTSERGEGGFGSTGTR